MYSINVTKLLQICRKTLTCVLFLFCQFSVDPALECTVPTVSGVDLAEFSVCGGRSVDWSERVYCRRSVGKTEGKRPPGRARHRCEDNITR